ncbi:MAG TPA: DUF4410 domain-containing protein [Thermoanaerobaculia bacterium]|nr:DUF4410 domain-containing protein [Thermoanaerobaculia bacterium]
MRTTARSTFVLCLVGLVAAAVAVAQTTSTNAPAATPAKPKKPVFVQDFTGAYEPAQSSSGRSGPLARIRGARANEKASQSASQLTNDIVKEFAAQGFTSKRLEPGTTLPTDGWLVRGTFYATDSGGNIIPTELLGGEQKPNTQLSVSVANLAKDPNAPFIVFGKAEALKGQGAPVGWNPYVVAAKFVINTVESATDLDKLAKEIVQTIMQNKQIVEEKALASNQ